MAIDMNADIGAMLKGLFSGKDKRKSEQNPYAKFIITSFVLLIITAVYVVFIFMPVREELQTKQQQIAQIESIKDEIHLLNEEITEATRKLAEDREQYEKVTKLFHTSQELEDLYRHISMLALTYQIEITKLEKAGENPVFNTVSTADENSSMPMGGDGAPPDGEPLGGESPPPPPPEENMGMDGEKSESDLKEVAYYKFKVRFFITGNYTRYTMFRRDLAKMKKTINIDKEVITVLESKKQRGNVKVSATFSTYRLPANDEERYLRKDDQQPEGIM